MTQSKFSAIAKQAEPLFLIVANVLSIGLGNAISIVLARNLSHEQFGNYVGTLATILLLASLAEAGFGKYGLKVIPVYWLSKKMGLVRGYLRFSVVGFVAFSVLLGGLALGIETAILGRVSQRVMLCALIFMPGITGFGVMIDLLLAFGHAITATVIARLIVPVTTLVAICVAMSQVALTPYIALLCFGGGSLVGMLLATVSIALIVRRPLEGVRPQFQLASWTSNGIAFLTFGFLISWVFKAPLFLAHHLPHDPNQLAILAPALEIGCWVLLLSKSTDKYFQPTMAILIESGDWAQGAVFRRNRWMVIGGLVVVFLVVMVTSGRYILSLYGEDFVAAYPSLLVIALGSSVWTLFSLAPSYMLFVGERSQLLKNMCVHAVVLVVSTVVLFPMLGAIGAAIAFATSIVSLTMVNLRLANQSVARRKSASS